MTLYLAEDCQIYHFRNPERTTWMKSGDLGGQIFGSKLHYFSGLPKYPTTISLLINIVNPLYINQLSSLPNG
jgi:hypothetical protein